MTALNVERLGQERRMRKRGTERVSDSGFTVDLLGRLKRAPVRAEAFIQEARAYEPIEEVVERNRHVPLPHSRKPRHDKETQAQRDEWLSGILMACEDRRNFSGDGEIIHP